ncbi:MAG: condensation domain-containing protein [Eubacteriales bacterium]
MSTYYDLTSAQNLLSLQQRYNLHRQCNNICTSILFDKKLDFDVLKKAVEIVYKRNDALRVRITKVDKKDKQYFADSGLQKIEMLDFTGKTREDMEKQFSRIAKKRITYNDKPLSRIYLVTSYDGKNGVCFINSHMILDSWGVTVFYRDLFEVYEALLQGKDMPKPIASYEKLLQKDLDYENTAKFQSDREFWMNEIHSSEPIWTDINGTRDLDKFRQKKKNPSARHINGELALRNKSRNMMIWFPEEIVEKAGQYCMANGFSMQHLFFLAYRSYFSKVNNREKDIYFTASIARRGTLEEKNSGGTRVHAIPFRTILEENTTFREALEKLKERQSIIYRHADFDYLPIDMELKTYYKAGPLASYACGMFTFQPVSTTTADESTVTTNWYDNGAYPGRIYLTVMDGDGTGSLKCYYQYRVSHVHTDTINKLHMYMENSILAGIENDRITIGELLDID